MSENTLSENTLSENTLSENASWFWPTVKGVLSKIAAPALVILILGTLMQVFGPRLVYGPVDPKLSELVTEKYLDRFQALGVTDLGVEYPDHIRSTNAYVSNTRGQTVHVDVDLTIGGATPFRAYLDKTSTGPVIRVRNDDDHETKSFDEISEKVQKGIDQALSNYQTIEKTEATWTTK